MKRIGFLFFVFLVACNPTSIPQPTQPFGLIPALESIELSPGGEASLWVKLDRSEGFDETVRMFLESLPAGVSQRWSRDTENGDCTLILSADAFVTPGKYNIDLLGEVQSTSSKLTTQKQGLNTQQTGQLSLVIIPTFLNLSLQPSILNLPRNSQTGMLVSVFGLPAPTADTTSFSLQGAPNGVVASFGALTTGSSFMTLSVSPTTPLGDHSFNVKVTTNSATKLAPLSLTVTAEPASPTFKLFNSALSLKLNRTDSKQFTVFISRIKGFDKAITLGLDTSLTQLTGVSAAPVNTQSTSLQSTLTIVSNNAAPLGQTFQTQVRGSAGNVFKQANLNISINLTPGSLDTSFSDNGVVENAGANRFTLLSNDKIVTVKQEVPFLLVKRHNVNGTLDTTFDSDGSISHPDQGMTNNFQGFLGIRALSDNKLIIAGSKGIASNDTGDTVVILKLKANGQLDTTFSGDGVFKTEMSDDSTITAFAIQADGKIIVAGADKNVGGGITLIRVLADGTQLDTSFGELGVVAINSEFKMSAIEEITVQPDGKILMAGARESGVTDDDGTLGRLLPSGLEDSNFAGGFQSIPFNHLNEVFFNVAQDLNQNILAIGLSGNLPLEGMMVRLKPDAKLDDSFSIDGRLTLDTNFLNVSNTPINTGDLVVQRNNKAVFLIRTELTGFKFLLVRLNTNGTRDTTFAGTGKVNLPSSIGIPIEMALDSQGRIVILGATGLARIVP